MPDKAELIVEGKKLAVSNLNKVLYPKAGFTKGQVIDYLHPHRAGASSAFERSSAHDEALPERSGSGVFLRKELSGPSPEMGADGQSLE